MLRCPPRLVPILLTGAFLAGCATTPLETEPTTSGIRAAEAVGAADVPRARYHLQLANEELTLAQKLSKSGERERASSMLARAEADAEMAMLLAREDAEKTQASEAIEKVRQLREDNQ